MAIMPHPAPRSNGTIYGVPFLFSMEKYGYILPDGKEFAYEEYDAMTEYVINNLPKFEKAVLDADNDDSRVVAPAPMRGDWGDIIRAATEDMVDFEDLMDKAISGTATTSTTASTGSTVTVEKLVADIADAEKRILWDNKRNFNLGEIRRENARIQLRWDKEFNRKVLDLVRKCIEQGTVHVAKMASISSYDPSVMNATAISSKVEHHTIVYPGHMTSNAAYMNVREQAEKIVKTTMEPPKLHRIP